MAHWGHRPFRRSPATRIVQTPRSLVSRRLLSHQERHQRERHQLSLVLAVRSEGVNVCDANGPKAETAVSKQKGRRHRSIAALADRFCKTGLPVSTGALRPNLRDALLDLVPRERLLGLH